MGRLIFDTLERDQSGFIPIVNDSSGDPATGPKRRDPWLYFPTVGGGSATSPIF
jgi:hypothetical protein